MDLFPYLATSIVTMMFMIGSTALWYRGAIGLHKELDDLKKQRSMLSEYLESEIGKNSHLEAENQKLELELSNVSSMIFQLLDG